MTAIVSEVSIEAPELRYHRCRWCGTAMGQPRLFCGVCGSTEMDEHVSAGVGTIRRVVRVYRPEHRGDHLRQTCSIHLDEGFKVLATVKDDHPVGTVPEGTRVRFEGVVAGHPAFEFTPC
jgi:uncharacterized OB-fold protein